MKRVGRDKYRKIVEGALQDAPPPPPKKERKKPPVRRCTRAPKHFVDSNRSHLIEACPGWKEWRSARRSEDLKIMPRTKFGRPAGSRHGIRFAELQKEQMTLNNLFANTEDELHEIAEAINAEPDPRTRLVMREYFKMILAPNCGDREKQNALKVILEFTKAKPASKSEVTVEDKTADEWTSSILEHDAGKDDWTRKPN